MEVYRYWCKILASMFAFLPFVWFTTRCCWMMWFSQLIYDQTSDEIITSYVHNVIHYSWTWSMLMGVTWVSSVSWNTAELKICMTLISRVKCKFVGSDSQTAEVTVTINWVNWSSIITSYHLNLIVCCMPNNQLEDPN